MTEAVHYIVVAEINDAGEVESIYLDNDMLSSGEGHVFADGEWRDESAHPEAAQRVFDALADMIENFYNRIFRIDHSEIHHRVNAYRNVILGDDFL